MSRLATIILSLCLLFSFAASSFAQEKGGGGGGGEMDQLVSESKNDLLVVVAGGLAGAILGLSTLSFVEEPKDHTKNILVGASLGIVAGVGYVAFTQANKSREMIYGEQASLPSGPDFETYFRSAWHQESFRKRLNPVSADAALGYSFAY